MAEVLKVRHPIVDGGEFRNHLGRLSLYRSIQVPLSDDRGSIGLLVGGARSTVIPMEGQSSA